jgi:hypothetical protein
MLTVDRLRVIGKSAISRAFKRYTWQPWLSVFGAQTDGKSQKKEEY